MTILGIDPGSARIGYGVISGPKKLQLIAYGTIEIDRKKSENPIVELSHKVADILEKYRPDIVGVEKLYFSKNVKTGIEVAQSRGVILLEAGRRNAVVREISPSEAKMAVTNYGHADKKAVAKMTAKILGIETLEGLDDAIDALAIAITAAHNF